MQCCNRVRFYNVSQLKRYHRLFILFIVIQTLISQQLIIKVDEGLDRMDSEQKEVFRNQMRRKFGIPEKLLSEPKNKVDIINKRGTDFDCQIVQSQELIQVYYSQNSGSVKSRSKKGFQNQIQQPHSCKKETKSKQQQTESHQQKKHDDVKQDILNVLIAGAQDTGKTTFIRCFKKKQREKDEPHIRTRTKQLMYEGGISDCNWMNMRNSVYFVDLPGFSLNEQDKYLKEIQQYANDQWVKYNKKPEQDTRIHCCLYFLRGARLKQIDINVMKKLSQMFNLIPVIAKSDQYTIQQILQIKEQFNAKCKNQNNAYFYDIKQFLGLELGPRKRNELMQTKFGKFPPFAISSSTEKQSPDSSGFQRNYPWGKLYIQNKQHTQFSKLCEFLSVVLKKNLITKASLFTDRKETQAKQHLVGVIGNQILEQPVNQKAQTDRGMQNILIVGSLAVAAMGWFSYFKLKGQLNL